MNGASGRVVHTVQTRSGYPPEDGEDEIIEFINSMVR